MRNIGKGSITIWLSLVICVILSLIFVCIRSVTISTARAYLSICMDESLFSEFARYDRILYDRYGLLVLDGGYGKGELNFAAVAEEIDDTAEKLISSSGSLFRVSLDETDITGYVLATDSGAAALRSQIADLMSAKLGADGVNRLIGMVGTNEPIVRQQEENGSVDPESIKETYERQKEEAARRAEAAAEETARDAEAAEGGSAESADAAEGTGAVEVPADFKNPLDNINNIMKMGIYNVILPDPLGVSNRSLEKSGLAEKRTFQCGMGLMPEEEDGIASHLLAAAYIADFFPNYLSASGESGIKYQAEFAIAGKDSDAANLKSVLDRMLLIRMGLNYTYLQFFAPEKKAEAESMALIISLILLSPEAAEAIAQILLLAWSYGESMMDLKTLLAGGKEPVIKDDSTWQLSLSELATFSANTAVDKSRSGLSYKDHLILLMAMMQDNDLSDRLLDLLEYNRRLFGNDPGFQIDSCIASIETETLAGTGDYKFSVRRSYGYTG